MDRESRDRRSDDERRTDHAPARRLLRRQRGVRPVARDLARRRSVLAAGESLGAAKGTCTI